MDMARRRYNGATRISSGSVMTSEEYYATVRRLGLRPSTVPHVYLTATNDVQTVPDATDRTSEQRSEIIEKLKERLGITPTEDGR
jgi:hypothetical protein